MQFFVLSAVLCLVGAIQLAACKDEMTPEKFVAQLGSFASNPKAKSSGLTYADFLAAHAAVKARGAEWREHMRQNNLFKLVDTFVFLPMDKYIIPDYDEDGDTTLLKSLYVVRAEQNCRKFYGSEVLQVSIGDGSYRPARRFDQMLNIINGHEIGTVTPKLVKDARKQLEFIKQQVNEMNDSGNIHARLEKKKLRMNFLNMQITKIIDEEYFSKLKEDPSQEDIDAMVADIRSKYLGNWRKHLRRVKADLHAE